METNTKKKKNANSKSQGNKIYDANMLYHVSAIKLNKNKIFLALAKLSASSPHKIIIIAVWELNEFRVLDTFKNIWEGNPFGVANVWLNEFAFVFICLMNQRFV